MTVYLILKKDNYNGDLPRVLRVMTPEAFTEFRSLAIKEQKETIGKKIAKLIEDKTSLEQSLSQKKADVGSTNERLRIISRRIAFMRNKPSYHEEVLSEYFKKKQLISGKLLLEATISNLKNQIAYKALEINRLEKIDDTSLFRDWVSDRGYEVDYQVLFTTCTDTAIIDDVVFENAN